jgi:hypothetical protein
MRLRASQSIWLAFEPRPALPISGGPGRGRAASAATSRSADRRPHRARRDARPRRRAWGPRSRRAGGPTHRACGGSSARRAAPSRRPSGRCASGSRAVRHPAPFPNSRSARRSPTDRDRRCWRESLRAGSHPAARWRSRAPHRRKDRTSRARAVRPVHPEEDRRRTCASYISRLKTRETYHFCSIGQYSYFCVFESETTPPSRPGLTRPPHPNPLPQGERESQR